MEVLANKNITLATENMSRKYEVGTLNKKISKKPIVVVYTKRRNYDAKAAAKKHYNFFKRLAPTKKRWLYEITDGKKKVIYKHNARVRK
jgi:hypothetical protein